MSVTSSQKLLPRNELKDVDAELRQPFCELILLEMYFLTLEGRVEEYSILKNQQQRLHATPEFSFVPNWP